MVIKLSNHTKLEVVGLKHNTNGRFCVEHIRGCGLDLSVGQIVSLHYVETKFTEQRVKITRRLEYMALSNNVLINILKDEYNAKGVAKKTKEQLVVLLLEMRNEPLDEYGLEDFEWTEYACEVYTFDDINWKRGCKVGFIARAQVNMFQGLLDNQFGKVLRLKDDSRFSHEQDESTKNGGSAVIETVERHVHISFE